MLRYMCAAFHLQSLFVMDVITMRKNMKKKISILPRIVFIYSNINNNTIGISWALKCMANGEDEDEERLEEKKTEAT
jgi:hypothetical protein